MPAIRQWCRQVVDGVACPARVYLDGESFASPVLEAADEFPHVAVAKRDQGERRFRAAVAAWAPAVDDDVRIAVRQHRRGAVGEVGSRNVDRVTSNQRPGLDRTDQAILGELQ